MGMRRFFGRRGVVFCAVAAAALSMAIQVPSAAAPFTPSSHPDGIGFAPDSNWWTTNPGQKRVESDNLPIGTVFDLGTAPDPVRVPGVGQHTYKSPLSVGDDIPVRQWELRNSGYCAHSFGSFVSEAPDGFDFGGLTYTTDHSQWYPDSFSIWNCGSMHKPGWVATCADCGELVDGGLLFYAEPGTIQGITSLHVGSWYYFSCPECGGLEQGECIKHDCNLVSNNRYVVRYVGNAPGGMPVGGHMSDSFHMYDNVTEFDGETVEPVRNLTLNAYSVNGYEFMGWNTEPDGSGTSYSDGQEILNLTDENYDPHVPGQGVVMLYAQWRPSQSSLVIRPNGGKYNGSASDTVVSKGHGESYVVDGTVTPPNGFLVSFDSMGGNPVDPIRQAMRFDGWDEDVDDGRFIPSTYTYDFLGGSGSVDYITARYVGLEVVLPTPTWPGHLFTGWYYDSSYTRPAGMGSTRIIPGGDLILYASWEDLRLEAVNNWTVNGGKGAVDLAWTLRNNATMVYKLYQSAVGGTGPWVQVSSATDVVNPSTISQSFTGSGSWTVPRTGLYTINASGAKGGDYGGYAGGNGGSVSAQFWLTEGEVLTYDVGGGAGSGSMYGSGGGYSRLVSSLQGELVTAGGGGGATVLEEGKPGGASGSIVSGNAGQDGMAGGGGGHDGGAAGEAVLHEHTDACLFHEEYSSTPVQAFLDASRGGSGRDVYSSSLNSGYGVDGLAWVDYGGIMSNHYGDTWHNLYAGGTASDHVLFETPGEGTLSFDVKAYAWGSTDVWPFAVTVYDQDGNALYSRTFDRDNGYYVGDRVYTYYRYLSCGDSRAVYRADVEDDGVSFANHETAYTDHAGSNDMTGLGSGSRMYGFVWTHDQWCSRHDVADFGGCAEGVVHFDLDIPESVEGVYFLVRMVPASSSNGVHTSICLEHIQYGYADEYYTCGYEEGDVESSMGANGGTSWVADFAYNATMSAGDNDGAASLSLSGEAVGFHTGMTLPGVTAPDLAAPNMVDADGASFTDAGHLRVGVTWQDPGDNGTLYWHKCEAYLVPDVSSPALTSNITENLLTSGVAGYRYVVDSNPSTQATVSSSWTVSPSTTVSFPESPYVQVRYVHVAAVDRAGNVGPTAHIRVSSDGSGTELYWDVLTSQIVVSGSNVYAKPGADREWYVKADGSTPFALYEEAYLNGPAAANYQPNHVGFVISGIQDLYYRVSDAVSDDTYTYGVTGISHGSTGDFALGYLPVSTTTRSGRNMVLGHSQQYYMDSALEGVRTNVVPVAGADRDKWTSTWSDSLKDALNGVVLIGDAIGPVYHGLEPFNQLKEGMIDRRDGDISVDITATDNLSGVRSWRVVVTNTDTDQEQVFNPGADGHVRINITEDSSLFSGDFVVNVYGEDNVGNMSSTEVGAFEFDLDARVERILAPHDPLFKTGESGYLYITTWGYVDYVTVEFPEEFVALNPGLDTKYVYRAEDLSRYPAYREDEKYQFMVPLYAPEGAGFKIKVTAYKGGKSLEKYPEIGVYSVTGTVLDEIRTRLR